MHLTLFQVDAFADEVFRGNPAAVMPLTDWLPDATLQVIAAENNLSETAFFVPAASGDADFELRWFTPVTEVDLCGHATLASAHVILNEMEERLRPFVSHPERNPDRAPGRARPARHGFPGPPADGGG